MTQLGFPLSCSFGGAFSNDRFHACKRRVTPGSEYHFLINVCRTSWLRVGNSESYPSIFILFPSSLILQTDGSLAPPEVISSIFLIPFLSTSPCIHGLPALPGEGGGLSFNLIPVKELPSCVILKTCW